MARAAPLPFTPATAKSRPLGGDASGERPQEGEKGRGARSNVSGRFESEQREALSGVWTDASGEDWGDGWGDGDPRPPALKTSVTEERARVIITRNQSPDVPFDRSINPYRGCEHGCVYCFARPTHAFMGLSPGLDFEAKLFAKPNAAALLERELSRKSYQPRVIAFGTNTDPYQPVEARYKLMRSLLKVLDRFNHPVSVLTKSALIMRDLDILGPMAERGLVKAGLSITTEDRKLARAMEPRAATPERRFQALEALAKAGVPTAVMTAPMIPALNDSEMESLLERAAAAGAEEAGYTLLRMPLEVAGLFREWLETFAPERAKRVLSLVRQTHGGRDGDARWYLRTRGEGAFADLVRDRFRRACAALKLNARAYPHRTDLFRPPPRTGADGGGQLSLFGDER
ncbi:MAG: PA0069 family radical SAM protein [Pseudomonadota bacterium]